MNYLSWSFLGEGIPFRYHLNEMVLKILVIFCTFIFMRNPCFCTPGTVHLNGKWPLPPNSSRRHALSWFCLLYSVVHWVYHFLISCLNSSQDLKSRYWASKPRVLPFHLYYLLLCNKPPPNFKEQTSSGSFCGLGIWKQFSIGVLAQGLRKLQSRCRQSLQPSGPGESTSKLSFCGCWQDASVSPHVGLYRAACVSTH